MVLPPELEHEQGPEGLAMISLTARVLLDHALDGLRLVQPGTGQRGRVQYVMQQLTEWSLEPRSDRYAESLLRPTQNFGRQQITHRVAQHALSGDAIHSEGIRHAERKLDDGTSQ